MSEEQNKDLPNAEGDDHTVLAQENTDSDSNMIIEAVEEIDKLFEQTPASTSSTRVEGAGETGPAAAFHDLHSDVIQFPEGTTLRTDICTLEDLFTGAISVTEAAIDRQNITLRDSYMLSTNAADGQDKNISDYCIGSSFSEGAVGEQNISGEYHSNSIPLEEGAVEQDMQEFKYCADMRAFIEDETNNNYIEGETSKNVRVIPLSEEALRRHNAKTSQEVNNDGMSFSRPEPHEKQMTLEEIYGCRQRTETELDASKTAEDRYDTSDSSCVTEPFSKTTSNRKRSKPVKISESDASPEKIVHKTIVFNKFFSGLDVANRRDGRRRRRHAAESQTRDPITGALLPQEFKIHDPDTGSITLLERPPSPIFDDKGQLVDFKLIPKNVPDETSETAHLCKQKYEQETEVENFSQRTDRNILDTDRKHFDALGSNEAKTVKEYSYELAGPSTGAIPKIRQPARIRYKSKQKNAFKDEKSTSDTDQSPQDRESSNKCQKTSESSKAHKVRVSPQKKKKLDPKKLERSPTKGSIKHNLKADDSTDSYPNKSLSPEDKGIEERNVISQRKTLKRKISFDFSTESTSESSNLELSEYSRDLSMQPQLPECKQAISGKRHEISFGSSVTDLNRVVSWEDYFQQNPLDLSFKSDTKTNVTESKITLEYLSLNLSQTLVLETKNSLTTERIDAECSDSKLGTTSKMETENVSENLHELDSEKMDSETTDKIAEIATSIESLALEQACTMSKSGSSSEEDSCAMKTD